MKRTTAYILMLLCMLQVNAFAQTGNYNEYAEDTVTTYTDEPSVDYEEKADEEEPHVYDRKFMSESKLEDFRQQDAFTYKDWETDTLEEVDAGPYAAASSGSSSSGSSSSSSKKSSRSSSSQQRERPRAQSQPFSFDGTILLWLLGGLLAVVLILKLAGINVMRIFAAKPKAAKDEQNDISENIHEIAFESELQKAINRKEYKLATKLLYLESLKLLSDKKIIAWMENKTNRQYEYEIPAGTLRHRFMAITSVFEMVCYGERKLDDEKFTQVHNLFNSFKTYVP